VCAGVGGRSGLAAHARLQLANVIDSGYEIAV
jgi:hypothetical protein